MKDEQLFDLRTYVDQTLLDAYTAYQPKALRFWGEPEEGEVRVGSGPYDCTQLIRGSRGTVGPSPCTNPGPQTTGTNHWHGIQ
jgi:hypothetical protein